jgi:signal transduction histidine kinase
LHASDLVAVRGTVMHVAQTGNGWQVLLRENAATIELEVAAPAPPLTPGSEISVVGISSIELSSHRGMEEQPNFVRLRVRSGPDVTILRQPPWWTPQRLGTLLAALALVIAITVIWILILRQQVRRQTEALKANIKLEAVRQERQRIAREFHDMLAQDLTGLRLRLDAIGAHALEHSVAPLLTASRSLVTRIQIETKNLVSDLRDPDQPVSDLRQVLIDLAEQCTSDRTRVRAEVAATPPSFPAATTHHLKMIAQEVVTNALRHANASEVVLRLQQRDEHWLLSVADDGGGFDVDACAHGTGCHFGCMGIRERCLKIDAGVSWISAPGEGTVVEVVVPRSPRPPSAATSTSHLSPCHPPTPSLS